MQTFSSTKLFFYGDLVFAVDENVYEPAEDSFLFAENLTVGDGVDVLDIGTGCGILGILAAKKARWVLTVDINPHAIRCAKRNASRNGKQNRMDFVEGDMFRPLSSTAKFDCILFNAPYLPSKEGAPLSWVERAWAGGASGREVIDHFIEGVTNHLKRNGRVMLMQSTFAGTEKTILKFGQSGMKSKIKAELALPFFERLFLIEAVLSQTVS